MGQFKIVERLDLGFLGKDWKKEGCFLEFTAITWDETEKLAKMQGDNPRDPKVALTLGKEGMALLERHFVKGKAIDEKGEAVKVKVEDLRKFPPSVIMKALNELAGEIPPNV